MSTCDDDGCDLVGFLGVMAVMHKRSVSARAARYCRCPTCSVARGEHHPDCDGWRMHSVSALRLADGTYKPSCPLCGVLPVLGSAGSVSTALYLGRDHSRSEPCDGRCRDWTPAACRTCGEHATSCAVCDDGPGGRDR